MKSIRLLMMGAILVIGHLCALEIRLFPPTRFYNIDGIIFIDLSSTETLLSGDNIQNLNYDIPITITYYIELYENKLIFDKQLLNLALVRRISYDHWSGQFFVAEGDKYYRYRNLTQLRNSMINLKKVRLIESKILDPNKEYYFKTRIAVKIKNFTLYYYLINNLISIFKYKTTYFISPVYSGKRFFD